MDLHVLESVWGDRSGYVFLPRMKILEVQNGKVIKKRWEEGPPFRWPDDRQALTDHAEESIRSGWEVYFCPLLFEKPRRKKEHVLPQADCVWADLDTAWPNKIEPRPTVAWRSSKGRYQALWLLGRSYSIKSVEAACRGIAYKYAEAGADEGGWDVTQVLRLPGSLNNKYGEPQRVKLLWSEDYTYEINDFPAAPVEQVPAVTSDTFPDPDRIEQMLRPYWSRIPARAKELLLARSAPVGERSDRLWEIENLLLKAQVPVKLVIDSVKLCVWNKFHGRPDEEHRVSSEIIKAQVEAVKIPEPAQLVEAEDGTPGLLVSYSKFVRTVTEDPQWLVSGLWADKSYGLIAGEPKVYKSVLATDLILSAALGVPFLGRQVSRAGSVIYIQEENSAPTVMDRLRKIASAKGLYLPSQDIAGMLDEKVHLFLGNHTGIDLTDPAQLDELRRMVETYCPVMLILDPLYMMIGEADENSSKDLRSVLQFFTKMRDKYEVSTAIIHHFRKQQQGTGKIRGGQRTRGSSIFHGWTESSVYLYLAGTVSEQSASLVRAEREFRSFPMQEPVVLKLKMEKPGELGYFVGGESKEQNLPVDLKKEDILSYLADAGKAGMQFDEIKKVMNATAKQLQTWLGELHGDELIRIVGMGPNRRYIIAETEEEE